jgi:hypothetical protein
MLEGGTQLPGDDADSLLAAHRLSFLRVLLAPAA